ncbi:mycofactocin oligosaccharide methyltransferase MftM [Nakamurella multipartita]|uniref:Methyltransferase type 11 n=1 Tax=Nakamurella multipartita (strain ATCC 700099 / DSM 44233 / CIP 104796 / JCM 9543 / NBRC 105858 / Y-104) TaxID=479431 RepID=C8X9B0_NAKMY|nr:mycofactocin oligosaccharide methyltransferase MftM [Nakamurella multipartita]ACV77178.1 Methyltransferase type 11 [Nakamurella multipartita DSM 44233]
MNTAGAATSAAPIDPLRRAENGCYRDELVCVLAADGAIPVSDTRVVRTPHFELWRHDWELVVRHRIPPAQIDDALTTVINDELFGPGWLSGSEMFERIFTGVVLTSAADPIEAWMLFYGNSLRRYDAAGAGDALADFASIHRHADALVPADASVLEIGCCFGFLSLRLARAAGRSVIASDLSAGTVRLLRVVADRLGVPLGTLVADAARLPRPDRSVDVVLMVHLLEHLDPDHCRRAIDEALRVAARRVVIAVPYEDEPTPAFGHLRTLDESDLRAWGSACPGWTWSVHEHLGGWLILDRG